MSEAIQHIARTWLETPAVEHGREFIAAMRDSKGLHHPWLTAPGDPESWRRYLRRLQRDNEAGYLVRLAGNNALCGVINLNVITYEALCSAYLSYYATADLSEQGYMKEGCLLYTSDAADD